MRLPNEDNAVKNYYAILEVPVGCSLEEIRQAYHRLVQAHLDDEAAFAELKEAYEVLSTPSRRAEYDKAAWGQVDPAQMLPLREGGGTGRCPMGPDAQCPVVQGRAASGEGFCPDCGYALSGLTPDTAFDAAALPDPARQARLEDGAGQTYLLKSGSNTVGREGTDVLVFDKTVSRVHAHVEAADGGTIVEDLGSTNGTRVNGERLMPHAARLLSDGDRVEFGSVSFTVRLPAAASAAPASETPPASEIRAQVVETREGSAGTYPLRPGLTTFGRRPENTVVISGDLYVSGMHAQIRADGDEFILTDTGSTNGTLLNGARLQINAPVTLNGGDVIVVGATALRFERLSPSGEVVDAEELDAEELNAEELDAETQIDPETVEE